MRTQADIYVRASLLDRLIDQAPKSPEEDRPLRAQTLKAFRNALRRDLEWLLNTRCPVSEAELKTRQRSVIDYGIIDFGTFFTQNPEDHQRLKKIFEDTLKQYEPRLTDICVTIGSGRSSHHSQLQVGLDARLDAMVLVDGAKEPISFPLILNSKQGITILDDE